MLKVTVVGASGLIGSAVAQALQARGHTVNPLRAPRPMASPGASPLIPAGDWGHPRSPESSALTAALAGSDAVIIAAGRAQPASNRADELGIANVLVPQLIYRAARDAGVPHVLHVSSAAVQGDQDPLDETPNVAPFSPYSRSKAMAETTLSSERRAGGPTLTLYRPTSVMARGRGITQTLVRHAQRRLVPYVMPGTQPLPLVHLEAVGEACVLLTTAAYDGVALQPWEGMDVLTLLRAFGADGRLVGVPRVAVDPLLRVLGVTTHKHPPLASAVRRAHLFAFGQRQSAEVLTRLGYQRTDDEAAYRRLADRVG